MVNRLEVFAFAKMTLRTALFSSPLDQATFEWRSPLRDHEPFGSGQVSY